MIKLFTDKITGKSPGFRRRNRMWGTVRRHYLKRHNYCEACMRKTRLEVHHIVPFHVDRDLELEPNNLITLCRSCHFVIGHRGDWKGSNSKVVEDAGKVLLHVIWGQPWVK